MQSVRYLHINSINRSYGHSHDSEIELKPAINAIKRVKLLALALPLSNYTVNTTNNQIYFNDGVTDFIAIITPGIYNSDHIVTAIKTAMEATGYVGTITVTFSENTYKLTISSKTNFMLQFQSFTTNSANHILGFDELDTSLSLSHEGDNFINISIHLVYLSKLLNFQQCVDHNLSHFVQYWRKLSISSVKL
jgi:hypothetical protein